MAGGARKPQRRRVTSAGAGPSLARVNAGLQMVQEAPDAAPAAQDDAGCHRSVFGDESPDRGQHPASVGQDVAEEVPGDAVVDADLRVLASAVPVAPFADAPDAGHGVYVKADH